jgi:hypothetical protein
MDSSATASQRVVQRSSDMQCETSAYDIQAYIYTKVFGIKDFYWVVQEKTYPYLPALVKCSDETLFTGEMKFNDAVNRIRQFLAEDYDPVKDYLQYEV